MGAAGWRIVRLALRLRQRDVADKVGISQARYSLLERGEVTATAVEQQSIDAVLQVSPEVERVLTETIGESTPVRTKTPGWKHR